MGKGARNRRKRLRANLMMKRTGKRVVFFATTMKERRDAA